MPLEMVQPTVVTSAAEVVEEASQPVVDAA